MGRFKPDSTPAEIAERDAARAAKLDALHTTLTEQVAALRGGPAWKAWLDVAAKFTQYSLNNTLLIAAQRPQASAVAGFGAWKALGRQVDKGERGIQIFAPMVRRTQAGSPEAGPTDTAPRADESTGTDPASSGRGRVAGFRVAHVFDLAQTSGPPLPERPLPCLLSGQAPAGLWDALAAQIAERGFTLQRGDCGPDVNGLTHYGARTVTVRADVDDAQAVKTLTHELGHVLLHDPAAPAAPAIDRADPAGVAAAGNIPARTSAEQCRGRIEVEAESVAYLVANSHGLDTGAYTFPYVAGWASSVDAATPDTVVRDTAGRVLAAARLVLAATEQLRDAGPADAHLVQQAAALTAAAERGADRTAALLTAAEPPAVTGPPGWAVTVADRSPGPAPTASPSAQRLIELHQRAVAFYTDQLHGGGRDAGRAAALLSGRGIDRAGAHAAVLGYAPRGWTALVDHLRRTGATHDELLASGLVITSARGTLIDRFRDRIIFPVRTGSNNQPVALLGRAVDATATGRDGIPVPKYLNSSDTVIYHKGEVLYGLSDCQSALAAGATPVLVEGPLDVHAINRAGQGFVGVAACGTALTAAQVELLEQATGGLAARGVITAFDADPAGRHAALRAFELLRQTGVWPHAVDLPAGHDPAQLLQLHGAPGLHAALLAAAGRPLADLVVDARIDRHTDQLQWVEGQLAAGRSAATTIATFPPAHVGRQASRVAARLDLPVSLVTELIVDAVSAPTWPTAHARKPPPLPAAPGTAAGISAAERARAGFPVALQASLHPPPSPSHASLPGGQLTPAAAESQIRSA